MPTLFSIPKAFRGHIDVIQRNAIKSWTLLRPQVDVILFGDEEGVAKAAAELGVRHMRDIERNEFGTPIFSDGVRRAEQAAGDDLLSYVNADIILLSDFTASMQRVADFKHFLMIGERCDFDVREPIDFRSGWEQRLRTAAAADGTMHGPTGIDYFAFRRGIWADSIPPFAVGRTAWDNWLIYGAWRRGAAIVDATEGCRIIHQNHDYNHASGGHRAVWEGPEAKRNLALAGGYAYAFTLGDANWVLAGDKLKRRSPRLNRLIRRRADIFKTEHPILASFFGQPYRFCKRLTNIQSPFRSVPAPSARERSK